MIIGADIANLLVEGAILVELKAVVALDAVHDAQRLNYLIATRLPLCPLLSFGGPRMAIECLANGIRWGNAHGRISASIRDANLS